MIPFFVFSTMLVNWRVGSERELAEEALKRESKELALEIDNHIKSTISILEAIAASDDLQSGKLDEFHKFIERVIHSQPGWSNITLHTIEKRVMSAVEIFSSSISDSPEPESVQEVFETERPVIGKVMLRKMGASGIEQYTFAVRVPIMHGGKVKYVLSAIPSVDVIQKLITPEVPLANEWMRTMVDANYIVAARTLNPKEMVGKLANRNLTQEAKDNTHGLSDENSLEGEAMLSSFAVAPFSKWIAIVGVPFETLEAPAKRAQGIVISIGLLLFVIFGGLAFYFSRGLVGVIQKVSTGAAQVGEGVIPDIPEARILEVEQLRRSLLRTAELLKSKEKERSEHLLNSNKARAEAEKANQTKSEFVANMSHELRTPLGIIQGMLDLYNKPEITPAEKDSLLARMRMNTEYLSLMIDQVLDLSKVEMNALDVQLEPFCIRQLLIDVIESFRLRAEAKGIQLELDCDDSFPENVKSDPLRVRQILMNIVGNAVKFTAVGSVKIRACKVGNLIDITVKDSGIGISAEQQQEIFRPFTQVDNSMTRRFGGAGLGLVVSKRLAQALGGDVMLVSGKLEQGSEFSLRFEDYGVKPEEIEARFQRDQSASKENLPSLKGMRILIVDDSADNRFIFENILTFAGAQVTEAEDGYAAVKAATSAEFDCILMDIQMPLMDGNQATAELRRGGYQKPILAVTAHAMKGDRDAALKAGYSGYLTKPINRLQLLKTISEFKPA
jgi:signal transduction histidine kinase